jgi:uncharacterized SAM-binding protein YcdF (DUF218 family)
VRILRWTGIALALLIAIITGLVWHNFRSIPLDNTTQQHFDVLIVLGTPANPDGSLQKEQRARVDEAVREYRAGVAPRLILTGGAAHNRFVEAAVMRDYALRSGVPEAALFEEDRAANTIQNLYYSHILMTSHGWHSAEIITSPHHVERASLIAQHFGFPYRVHSAHWPPHEGPVFIVLAYTVEATRCWRLTHYGFPHSPFLPGT